MSDNNEMTEYQKEFKRQGIRYDCRLKWKEEGSTEHNFKAGSLEQITWDAEAQAIEWEQEQSA